MKNKTKQNFIQSNIIFPLILSFLLILIGCMQGNKPNETTVTNPINTFSQTPKKAVITLPAATSKPTKITTPANTSLPSSTPLPKSTNFSPIELPSWVADPKTEVLLYQKIPVYDQYETMVLLNAVSGEKFELPKIRINGYFWLPNGEQFGYITMDNKNLLLVNIKSGEITEYPFNPLADKLHYFNHNSKFPVQLIATGNLVTSPEFSLIPEDLINRLSYDHRYYLVNQYGLSIVIRDLQTGDEFEITDLEDELYDFDTKWSPTQSLLAISQSNEEPGFLLGFSEKVELKLKVYDVDKREFVAVYQDISMPEWSPDGSKLLFQPFDIQRHAFWTSPICIFNILDGSNNCFIQMLYRHVKTLKSGQRFSSIHWMADQKIISYVYTASEIETYDNHGGLCFLDVNDSSEKCIMQNLENTENNVMYYDISPSNSFAMVVIDENSPFTDYNNHPQLTIANLFSGKYFVFEDYAPMFFHTATWRPSLKIQN